ncbi:hypothetical protein [Luteimonas terrae]|uniref:DUF3168 domain-containing protein n=1 Tax=Luteimonas terrae TaxID=1530191 RepID=A0ABU1XX54_9GAMM|nr:hypothetical protein [Luteimonas terrae]MDR7193349.1 hypothetical protein [Luteimonas terrae]
MSAAVFAALAEALKSDSEFIADMQALALGRTPTAVPKVLEGNRRFDQLGQEHYPCWLIEPGDSQGASASNDGGDLNGLVLNSTQQDWLDEIDISLVWHQQDYPRALTQRKGIVPAVVRLLLRNPGLGDASLIYAVGVLNDRSYRHPTHVQTLTLRAHTTIDRDPD